MFKNVFCRNKDKMRRRNINRKEALKVVKELDAFPKVPESYQETSISGGGGMNSI